MYLEILQSRHYTIHQIYYRKFPKYSDTQKLL